MCHLWCMVARVRVGVSPSPSYPSAVKTRLPRWTASGQGGARVGRGGGGVAPLLRILLHLPRRCRHRFDVVDRSSFHFSFFSLAVFLSSLWQRLLRFSF